MLLDSTLENFDSTARQSFLAQIANYTNATLSQFSISRVAAASIIAQLRIESSVDMDAPEIARRIKYGVESGELFSTPTIIQVAILDQGETLLVPIDRLICP